jgi:hypothetical protein
LNRADCLPRLLAEHPIDVDILASPVERTLEASYFSAPAADLKPQVLGRPDVGGQRHARCGSAEAFVLQQAQHLDIQLVDATAQPGHLVPECRYLDALVSRRCTILTISSSPRPATANWSYTSSSSVARTGLPK